jgi:hypothetical protein
VRRRFISFNDGNHPALRVGMLSIGACRRGGANHGDQVQVHDRRLQRLVMRRQGQWGSAANDTHHQRQQLSGGSVRLLMFGPIFLFSLSGRAGGINWNFRSAKASSDRYGQRLR